jgi:hypothetical protein
MSWNQHEVISARLEILETIKRILSKDSSTIEGARIISRCRFKARLEDDADILPFVGIDSETDALPLGHDQVHWQALALADLQPEIERAETWARTIATGYCQSLLAREAALLLWPD